VEIREMSGDMSETVPVVKKYLNEKVGKIVESELVV
jgi:hypothetical protein